MRKVFPILEYDSTLTSQKRIGFLSDAVSCRVTEERNGEFYCEMTYLAAGHNADLLRVGRIISVPSRPGKSDPFRIQTIVKNLDGTMDITAYHISYDLSNVIIMPFTANTITNILTRFATYGIPSNSFRFFNQGVAALGTTFTCSKPTPLRNLLFGGEESLVNTYGGEFKFENWRVLYYKNRGSKKNVTFAYGKNLTSFTATDENGKYDAVIPFAVYEGSTYYLTDTGTYPDAPVVKTTKDYGYPRTLAVDFTDKFTDSAPTEAQLYSLARTYISEHTISPTENIASGYVDLRKLIDGGDTVELCDTISLNVPMYQIQGLQLKIIRTVYNSLNDEYESLQVGDKKYTLADTLAELMR